MRDEAAEAAAFTALVAALAAARPDRLSPLPAGILAALHLGIAGDSRSFARIFGIAHALVLRETVALGEDPALLHILRRDDRTQRQWLALTPVGQTLISGALISEAQTADAPSGQGDLGPRA